MVIGSRLRVLDPTIDPAVEGARLAPRLGSLNGKVLGLFSNYKLNSAKLVDMVGTILSERYQLKGIVRGTYSSGRLMRRDEWQGVERCDVIVLATGD